MVYETVTKDGLVLRSCTPFRKPRAYETNPVLFLVWSYSFRVRKHFETKKRLKAEGVL